MRSIFRKFLSLTLAVAVASAPLGVLASDALGDELAASAVTVNERTELNTGTFWSNTYSDLREENYVVYSPNRKVTPVVTGGDYATHLVTTSAAAAQLEEEGYRVVAGVNGDYYDTATGLALGCVMIDGTLKSISNGYYAVGFCDDGSAVMGKPTLRVEVTDSYGGVFEVSALNQVRQSGYGIFLYDDAFNARGTVGTSEAGVDVVCSVVGGTLTIGGTLRLVVEQVIDGGVDTAVGEGQYVLSANSNSGSYAEALRALSRGERLSLTVTEESGAWDDVTSMVGAFYRLVEDGEVCAGLPTGAAPRTAVGIRYDGALILYTIDGRQSGYSIGASLTQVAERMVELGCVTALSLDGGGSTTMVATRPDSTEAGVVNRPSGSERAVTNHIFLVASNRASGSVSHVYLSAESSCALPNAQVKLTAVALDSNYIPVEGRAVSLSCDRGSIEDGVLTMPASGSVTVRARCGSASETLTIQVAPSVDSIAVQQNGAAVTAISLAAGESVELSAAAVYRHLSIPASNESFTWRVEGEVGTVENGVLTAANRAGSGSLVVSLGAVSVTVPVTVTTRALRTLEGFETAFSTLTGTRAMLSHNQDMSRVHNGFASARLDYATGQGDAAVTLRYAVPSGYDQLNVWVYGDGSGATLSAVTDTGSVTLGLLDFTGWQLLSAALGSAQELRGFAVSDEREIIGAVYLDQLVLSYGGLADSSAPVISLALDEAANTVSGTVLDDVDGAAVPVLSVRYDGKDITSYTFNSATGALSVTLPAADGAQHRLTVTAGDASGNLSRASVDTTASDTTAPFADMQGHWASAAVAYLSRSGITNGSGSGNYSPETNITRQEFALLLERYLATGKDYSNVTLPFVDSASIDSWALSGAKAMYALGVIKGSDDGNGNLYFNPHANVSRQEVVTMLGRLLEKGYATPALTFTDSASIQSWSAEYVSALSAMGILSGMGDGRFCPNDPMTRAQIAAVLYKML